MKVIDLEIILKILKNMPLLLQYYIPGFWTMILFKYFCSKEFQGDFQNIMSCVVSYVLLSISALLVNIPIFSSIRDSIWGRSAMAILFGTLFAFICSWLFCSQFFSNIMVKLFHKTPNDNIWRDVLDLSKGSNLKLYIREADYYVVGHHRNIEEKGNDSWVVLTGFIKLSKKDNNKLEDHEGDLKSMIAIRLADIEFVEIFN